MKQTGPIDPKKAVADAKRSGLIWRDTDVQSVELGAPQVKLPGEVGLQRIWPNRKANSLPVSRPASPRKWITKGEARAMGYNL